MFAAQQQQQPQMQSMQNLAAAEHELEMVTELYNKIVSACHAKCIPTTYHEGDLNKGESVCIDRCVAKYFAVNKKVTEKFEETQKQKAQQMQQ